MEDKMKKTILLKSISILGLPLCLFYGILFIASLVNLPSSWFGSLWSLLGIVAGSLCFLFLKTQNRLYLVFILPAAFFMFINLLVTAFGFLLNR
jgi:hypothetical protein